MKEKDEFQFYKIILFRKELQIHLETRILGKKEDIRSVREHDQNKL